MHTPSSVAVPRPGRRGEVKGWSAAAARRHVKFLQGVDVGALDGVGYAVTLTLREIPESATEWSRMRDVWLKRMGRLGMVRVHWVTEWQKRGAPHLHAAVYFPERLTATGRLDLIRSWLAIAGDHGAQVWGQRVEELTDAAAWGRYCAKHSARSSSHAQRQGMPPGWTKSGRLWGQGGAWPRRELTFAVDMAAFHQLRRLTRSWRIADARQEREPATRRRREILARRCLSRSTRGSAVWGMREWVPEHVTLAMVLWLIREGYDVHEVRGDADAEVEREDGRAGLHLVAVAG